MNEYEVNDIVGTCVRNFVRLTTGFLCLRGSYAKLFSSILLFYDFMADTFTVCHLQDAQLYSVVQGLVDYRNL